MYNELGNILQYIISNIEDYKLVDLYNNLSNLYEQARATPSPEVTQNIQLAKNQIEEAQRGLEPSELDEYSVRIFYKFDSNGVLGNRGLEKLNFELATVPSDPHGASEITKRLSAEINERYESARQSLESLKNIFYTSKDDSEKEKKGSKLQIIFDQKVDVETFDDLAIQAKLWNQILDIAIQLTPDGKEHPTIQRIHKSSPLVIVIDGPIGVVVLLGILFWKALEVQEKMLNIEKAKKDIELTDLLIEEKKQILGKIQDATLPTLSALIKESTKKLAEDQLKNVKDSYKPIAINAAKIIIEKMYNFAVGGGFVSTIGSQDQEESESIPIPQDIYKIGRKRSDIKELRQELGNPLLPLVKRVRSDKTETITTTVQKLEQASDIFEKSEEISSEKQVEEADDKEV